MSGEGKGKFVNNWYVLRDCLLASIFGILLGYLIDVFFPLPKKAHAVWFSLIMIILQVVIDGFIIYYYGEIFTYFFGRDPDDYRGFTVFGVLFFLVQIQLLTRLNYVFQAITGRSFE